MTGHQRVVLDATSFIKGRLIATTLWVGVMLIVAPFVLGVPTVLGETDVAQLLGAGLSLAFYGFGIALVFAAPLGWVLACLLRPVRQQRIHIAAFFVVPTHWPSGWWSGCSASAGTPGGWD